MLSRLTVYTPLINWLIGACVYAVFWNVPSPNTMPVVDIAGLDIKLMLFGNNKLPVLPSTNVLPLVVTLILAPVVVARLL